ncbi:hypothetical protein CASFOL_022336 [Castilleja foliolosa]|uniref:Pentatricopeptide repeat-containing protein n=1 Tax=Castilleja foliolosa TaxID=1961234 RepID=A0ABD3CWY5_9LAMI
MSNMIFNHSKSLNTNKRVLLFSYIQSRFIAGTSVLVPSHQQIAHLILEQKSAKQALQTFEWASKIQNFTHTQSTYRALIHRLCIFRQFNIVEQVLEEMPQRISLSPDDDIFVTIARGFGRAGMTRQVIGVLDLVTKFGKTAPSLKLLNTILDVLVKVDIDIAREFYRKKIMGSGMKGDDYTYGIMMKGFCLTNRISDCFKLLQVMKSRGVKVNVVMYNTLIHALCKNGKVGRARSLTNEIENLNDVTYNILISAYCNEKNLVQSLVMLEKCFSNGFVPDIIALTKLVKILCDAGRLSEAVEVLERAEKNKGTLDVVTYNTLLGGFVKAGKVKSACGFLKQMEMKGCLPNTETYNVLIKGLCDSEETLDRALDMFDEMKRVGVRWDFVTFEIIIHGLCSFRKIRDGFKIFEIMLEGEKMGSCHIGPYNSILYGLYKENHLDKALEFLNYMKSVFPRVANRSLSILRLCHEGDNNTDEVKLILDKMREEGDFPSAIVYAGLVRALCENGRMKEAVETMNEMIGFGYVPIASTFNSVICGFCRRGKIGAGLRLLEDLEMRGCFVDCESYRELIRDFCIKGELQQAVMLFMKMVEKGIVPDYLIWNELVMVSLEGKNYEIQEHELLQWLIEI